MNILDEKFAEFQKLPTEDRIECFEARRSIVKPSICLSPFRTT